MLDHNSLWTRTLDAVNSDLAAAQPSPAAGSAAAVSARLAVSLLIKVLELTKRRKSVAGNRDRIDALLNAARLESEVLAKAADGDGAAFAEYLACVRSNADEKARNAAMLGAIEVPMTTARSSVRALTLGREAVSLVPTFIAADLGAAALLLAGAVRAVLITVDYNMRQLTADKSNLAAERAHLEDQSRTQADAIVSMM
jgi:methenyltetrahydrofolate cyclohydrolase